MTTQEAITAIEAEGFENQACALVNFIPWQAVKTCLEVTEGQTAGVVLIGFKRREQVERHAFDAGHDDLHDTGELAMAGDCYLTVAALQVRHGIEPARSPSLIWPFEREAWRPSPDPVINLQKAGALIAAEIDRLLRLRERQLRDQR